MTYHIRAQGSHPRGGHKGVRHGAGWWGSAWTGGERDGPATRAPQRERGRDGAAGEKAAQRLWGSGGAGVTMQVWARACGWGPGHYYKAQCPPDGGPPAS